MIDTSHFFRRVGGSVEVFVTGLSLTFTKLVRENIDPKLSDTWKNRVEWVCDTIISNVPTISTEPNVTLDCRMENFYLNYLGRGIIDKFNLQPNRTKILTTVEPKTVLDGYQFIIDRLSQTNYCHFYDNLTKENIDWKGIEIDRPVISLSGRATENRARFTKDLLDLCKDRARISFGKTTHYDMSDEQLEIYKSILHPYDFPVQLGTDQKVLGSILTQHTAPGTELYKSLLSVVNETNDFSIDNIYLSEKSFKVFAWHQIPIFSASPGHVQVIRSLGFDVFDDIIDHSYDCANNQHLHRLKILNAISKFLQSYPTITDVNLLREKIWSRLEANGKLLDEFNKNKQYQAWPYYG